MDGFYLCKGDPRADVIYNKTPWSWGQGNLDASSGEESNLAPNGESVFLMVPNTSNVEHYVNKASATITEYSTWNEIIYVKLRGNQEKIKINGRNHNNQYNAATIFDLILGKISSNTWPNNTHCIIESIGDNWYKCGISIKGSYTGENLGTSPLLQLVLIQPGTDTTTTYSGLTSDGIYLWKGFGFYSDEIEHYFPDRTDAADTEYIYSPSQSVRFYPLWDVKFNNTQLRFDSTDLTGRRLQYITGKYDKWIFDIPIMESYKAFMVNNWWKNNDLIYFHNGIDFNTYKCAIVNKKEPFDKAHAPYSDLMQGSLELEVVNG